MDWYKDVVRPLLFRLDAERVHEAVLGLGSFLQNSSRGLSLIQRLGPDDDPALRVRLFGREFAHPLGLAAGFDKDGAVSPFLAALGFSHLELGTVTLYPQAGNPRPRIFRNPRESALYNSCGFPGGGLERFAVNRQRLGRPVPLGASLGKMKHSEPETAVKEYRLLAERLAPDFDYLVINVSSPNTPGLRDFQVGEVIRELLAGVGELKAAINAGLARPPAWLVKTSPNLSVENLGLVVSLIREHNLDGIVVTNTIPLCDQRFRRWGRETVLPVCGLSGRPLTALSTQAVRTAWQAGEGQVPVIGVGGIFDARDAWEKILAGASLVQLYTGFIYGGPRSVARIVRGLGEIVRGEGFETIGAAVGAGSKN
jgi:dihydroorotate dehydrogenase